MSEIAIAYDVGSADDALALDQRLGEGPEIAKVGLQLFTAAGPDVVRQLRARGRRVFLDLKLHDIPNTVEGAAAEAARLGAELLTGTSIVAVTLLTSLDPSQLPPGFARPFELHATIAALLEHSERAGARGIVCSAADLEGVRALRRAPFFAVTPGIRPHGGASHDQARVATITDAVRMGASVLVLGRAVTGAGDPRAALAAARAERDAAMRSATAARP
jgi:orotidine-5'-phosphate decarboxylase